MRKANGNQPGSPVDPDDLQQIKGIGQATAKTLNSLGIYRVSDLAQYTNEELVVRLREHLSPLALKRIEREDWVGQARLMIQLDRPQAHSAGGSPPTGWQELADFFISLGYTIEANGEKRLQTKAHHSQADLTRQWDGLAMPELVQWMLLQSGLTLPAEALSRDQPGEPEGSAAEFELELFDLWIAQVAEEEGQKKAQKLRATCSLSLAGPKAEVETYEQSPYQVETYLVNRTTNQSQLVASCFGALTPGQLGYSIQQDFKIPAVGSYQIYVVARLQTPGSPAAQLQGPVLQVEP